MAIALCGDAKIYYEVHGSGPAVLFVHGSGDHHAASCSARRARSTQALSCG
jgi:hypothetical protein